MARRAHAIRWPEIHCHCPTSPLSPSPFLISIPSISASRHCANGTMNATDWPRRSAASRLKSTSLLPHFSRSFSSHFPSHFWLPDFPFSCLFYLFLLLIPSFQPTFFETVLLTFKTLSFLRLDLNFGPKIFERPIIPNAYLLIKNMLIILTVING